MIAATLSLGFFALAAASPLARRAFPPTITSKGFNLIVNVTDPTKDFSPSVHGLQISAWHEQSIFSRATPSAGSGNVFYQNGTADETYHWSASILTDLGPNQSGFLIDWQDKRHNIRRER